MLTRDISLFLDTYVHTANGFKQVADLKTSDGFYDNFGRLMFLTAPPRDGGEQRIVQLATRNQFISISLPETAMVKAVVDDNPTLGPYSINDLKASKDVFLFLPKRKLRPFEGDEPGHAGVIKGSLSLDNDEARSMLLTRLETPSEDDGIEHVSQALYLRCDALEEAKYMAAIAQCYGVKAVVHPNTPIVYLDPGRPACFISKLASGVFEGSDAVKVISEFYGNGIFAMPQEIDKSFIAFVQRTGVIFEGLAVAQQVRVTQIGVSKATAPTRVLTVSSTACIDTPQFQI